MDRTISDAPDAVRFFQSGHRHLKEERPNADYVPRTIEARPSLSARPSTLGPLSRRGGYG
jgi:hypothetical protein